MKKSETDEPIPGESRHVWLWCILVLFFFGLQALLWTNAIALANRHPATSVPQSPVPESRESSLPNSDINNHDGRTGTR